MFKFIIVIGIVFWIVVYFLYLSPMARSTRELSRLNRIWESFNNGKEPELVRLELKNYDWKYHPEKIKLLYKFLKLKK